MFLEIFFLKGVLSFVIQINPSPDAISVSPLPPDDTMFMVLFNPVPLSIYPSSFFVDNPLIAWIIPSQSFSN